MRTMRVLMVLAASLSVGVRLFAYPTSVNVMPTADVLDTGTASLQLESDGWPTPVSRGRELAFYAQVGLTDRCEIGADLTDLTRQSRWLLNAKWQLCTESRVRPALAVGVLNPSRGGLFSEWYAVASKDSGSVRLHGGVLGERGRAVRGMVGVEHEIAGVGTALADWTSGAGAYHTVGLYRDLTGAVGALVYYAGANASGDADYVGLNICWSVTLRRSAGGSEP